MGMRGSPTGEIMLDDVQVPAENLIGEEGKGFAYAMGALDGSRPIVGAQAVGIAQGALDAAARYVVERRQFGQRIADFQGVQFMLADMATQVEAARLLVYEACTLLDAGDPRVSQGRVDGQALRGRHRDAGDDRRRPAVRWRRLHASATRWSG